MAKRMMIEEKRQAILDIFEKSRSFYKMQELEKIGSREKGIVENTIKDVVTGLLHDDLISGDKIGTSIYYWGNHNRARHRKMIENKKTYEEMEKIKEAISKAQEDLRREEESKPQSEKRKELLSTLKDLEKEEEDQSILLKGYSSLGVEEIQKMKDELESIKKEINTLTDNIFMLQDYVCSKFGMDKKEFNESFGVSPEMDYVE